MWYYMMQHTFFVKNLKNNAKKTRIVLDEESLSIHVLQEKLCIMHKKTRNFFYK